MGRGGFTGMEEGRVRDCDPGGVAQTRQEPRNSTKVYNNIMTNHIYHLKDKRRTATASEHDKDQMFGKAIGGKKKKKKKAP